MRAWLIALLVLPLTHCSCQRAPDAVGIPDSPSTIATDPPLPAAARKVDAMQSVAPRSDSRAAARAAASVLHAYLAVAPSQDRSRADAYWSGGSPGPAPGDALLRARTDMLDLRIDNALPQPLDAGAPPQSFEIPVALRLRTAAGTQHIDGWYRLRLGIDGERWEITSASLQPRLD